MNPSLRDAVAAKVTHYLALCEKYPDLFPLTIQAVADYQDEKLGLSLCHPNTLRNHGQADRIRRKKQELKEKWAEGGMRPPSFAEKKAAGAAAEAELWKTRYHEMLRKLRLIEFHLRQVPGISLDAIYDSEMPKPDRTEPKSTRGATRCRHGPD